MASGPPAGSHTPTFPPRPACSVDPASPEVAEQTGPAFSCLSRIITSLQSVTKIPDHRWASGEMFFKKILEEMPHPCSGQRLPQPLPECSMCPAPVGPTPASCLLHLQSPHLPSRSVKLTASGPAAGPPGRSGHGPGPAPFPAGHRTSMLPAPWCCCRGENRVAG